MVERVNWGGGAFCTDHNWWGSREMLLPVGSKHGEWVDQSPWYSTGAGDGRFYHVPTAQTQDKEELKGMVGGGWGGSFLLGKGAEGWSGYYIA